MVHLDWTKLFKEKVQIRLVSFSARYSSLIYCFLATFCVSCAKVGEPLPPLVHLPTSSRDLTLVQVADQAHLIFSVPQGEIRSIEVYRQCQSAGEVKELQQIADLPLDQLTVWKEKGRFVFVNGPISFSQPCHYAIRFVDARGRHSEYSNFVVTGSTVPSLPPSSLGCKASQDQILVHWTAPQGNLDGSKPAHIVGYLVNSKHFVIGTQFEDLDFEFGQLKQYRVQVVSYKTDPLILSEFSDTFTFVPEDAFAPVKPQNFTALYWEGKVQLHWDPNEASDLQGYVLYKGTRVDRLEKLSPVLGINSYMDREVLTGVTYYYEVSVLDTSGNESLRSQAVLTTPQGRTGITPSK